jgi:hypothetical protein
MNQIIIYTETNFYVETYKTLFLNKKTNLHIWFLCNINNFSDNIIIRDKKTDKRYINLEIKRRIYDSIENIFPFKHEKISLLIVKNFFDVIKHIKAFKSVKNVTYEISKYFIENNKYQRLPSIKKKYRTLEICKLTIKNNSTYISDVPEELLNNEEIINTYLQTLINENIKRAKFSEETITKLKNLSI